MHQSDVGRIIERGSLGQKPCLAQQLLGILVTLLCHVDAVRLLIHREITRFDHPVTRAGIGLALLAYQVGHQRLDCCIDRCLILRLTTDDQRCSRFIDQNGIDLINNGVVQPPLHTVTGFVDHVVPEVVKPVFIVRPVCDVRSIGRLLLFSRCLRQVDANGQTEKAVEAAHPLRVSAGQVVIDRHHMHAFAGQCIEIDGKSRRQRLAFTRAHLCHFAMMQGKSTHHLHVEMTHLHDALAALTNDSKGLRKNRVQ